jgi:hypothetical protein
VNLTKNGPDYSFERIGNVDVMRQALGAVATSLQAIQRFPGSSPASGLRPQHLFNRALQRRAPSIPRTQSVNAVRHARTAPEALAV